MIPINKNSPKLMNFTKTDENIIPIYIMKGKEVSRATILSKKHHGEALAGERVFVVKYLKWRPDCPYPLGLAIRHIPHGRYFKTGMEILFEEYNIKREFDKKLRKTVEIQFSKNWQVPASEKGRPVYRDNVFTIDPPESLDLDDAISIRSLGNGNYELHIHIADVSYFVQPNTPLDDEARLRGTSYYPPKPKETVPMPNEPVPMPKETVPMLPRELSEDCCSLLEGKDRLALTLSVEVKPDGTDVGDARIERSVVRSSARLTYLQAQKFIDETSQTEVPMNGEVRNSLIFTPFLLLVLERS
jgi:exoribonuclease R